MAMTPHSSSPGILTRTLPLILFCFLTSSFQGISITHAQVAPIPNTQMPYARVGSKFYVQSGPRSAKSTPIFSLDLSKSWSVNAPAWTAENFGNLINNPDTLGIDDDKSLQIINRATGVYNRWNISNPNAQWIASDSLWSSYCLDITRETTMDARTGWTYSFIKGEGGAPDAVCVDSKAPEPVTVNAVTDDIFGERIIDGAVYNSARATVMIGYRRLMDSSWGYLLEYSIDGDKWTKFNSTGERPTKREQNCMVIDSKGTKIVVFGGSTVDPTNPAKLVSSPELFVLDLQSRQWRKAPNAATPRAYAACTLVGDQFIVWGGQNSESPSGDGSILLFDLSKFEWATTYTPPSDMQSRPELSTGSSTANIGAIAGGAAGGLIFLAAIAGLFIYRRRQKQKSERSDASGKIESSPEDHGKSLVCGPQLMSSTLPALGRNPHGEPAPKYRAIEQPSSPGE
ncbi:hypothetical protein BX616_001912 [Lobosporangium transversale]|uniref:Kelch repeat protein n=1 Tax=Lobosporangium transversale TaxID=64571 RepID=A0A1Y2H3K9_9FUNG|nr:hypothetical protein BCR41DRAFT_344589 [Lobosporangium transversale]KAF9902514.1 hypothetical protein BX616_001912 [Lobosporangium transversale]ORZ29126.1 hypothetical protein BCR41DRAFT_344589 [Lobosporangium transversale]|eukprot:XP_021886799.1 hypothetical protein BCR41DRAFT_344589 [Lobosporangium transversale]